MLPKRLSRWRSRTDGSEQPLSEFPDSYWSAYLDLLTRNATSRRNDVLTVNTKKYSSNSSAVTHLRGLFPPDLQPSVAQIIASLKSPFSQGGNIARTYFLIRVVQLSQQGFFITNDDVDLCGNKIKLMGAENWENVMCYMNALLFSMFAKLDSFEPVLFLLNHSPNPLVGRLSALLRVYVNLLRMGSIITTDISQAICECLSALGFSDAMSHRQQDCAPLFEFLTETLAMPLLTFRVEIQHSGKSDDDDRRYSKERILFVSLPDLPEGSDTHDPFTLEECLEHYFNNSISVRRELQRRATLDSLRRISEGDIGIRANGSIDHTDVKPEGGIAEPMFNPRSAHVRVRTRSSTLSVWSIKSIENKPKEVMLPAWMLLRLLPFYTDDNDASGGPETIARNSVEFANRRPVLPICLKRYLYSQQGSKGKRSLRQIIIPPVIDLPLFVDSDTGDSGAGFKLILESAVCHRGASIESGHFVSAVRVNSSPENETIEQSLAAQWYLYDDMKKTRVVVKTFKELFDSEWPYFLFYRLVASNDDKDGFRSSSLSMRQSYASSPVVMPRGAKGDFWTEPSCKSKLSENGIDKNPFFAEMASNTRKDLGLSVPDTESVAKIAKAYPTLLKSTEGTLTPHVIQNPEPASITFATANHPTQLTLDPLIDLLPTNPKFVDIRKRFLWYVTDRKKNYYKETALLSKKGSNISISVTPQFRRTSDESILSNISGLALESRPCFEKDSSKEDQEVKEETVSSKDKKTELRNISSNVSRDPYKERKHLPIHKIFSHEKDGSHGPPHLGSGKNSGKNSSKNGAKCILM